MTDVLVTFGCDTKGLDQALADVAAQMNDLSQRMRSVAADFANAGDVAESDLGAKLKSLSDQVADFSRATNQLRGAATSVNALSQEFQKLVQTSSPWAATIDDANRKIQALQQGLKGGTTDAAALVRQFEGFREKAYWDRTGYAVGYGTHKTSDGGDVGADSTMTRQQAEENLSQRIVEFQQKAAAAIGPAWDQLSARAKASIVDITYNYGHTPDNVAAAAKTGDDREIVKALRELAQSRTAAGDRAGAGRRNAEAANIAAGSGATDAKLAAQVNDALSTQRQRIVDVNAARSGGTAIAQAELDILRRRNAGQEDDLAEAREKLTAAKTYLDLQQTDSARARAQLAVAQAEYDLKEKQIAVTRSQLQLEVGRAQGGGADGQRDAQVKLAEFEMAQYARGSARYNQYLGQKEAADRNYRQQKQRDDAAAENADYQNGLHKLEAADIANKQALQDHEISAQEMLAQDTAIEAQRAALEKQHYEKLKAIWGEGSEEYRKAQTKLLEVDEASNARRTQAALKADKEIQASFDQTFKVAGSSLSSSIMGMLQGAQKFSGLMRNVATQITQHFIQMGVDMAMNWAATLAKNVMLTMTSEGAMTAAKQAGSATRLGLDAGEAAAATATKLASVAKSIMASAAEAFAGVFGFMAPVMGPAAAGPAAAAQATVMGMAQVASMDIGAYNLPSDMLALVHKNEMVMPAGPAQALRGLLESGGGGGGNGGDAHYHGHAHLNVQAIDGQSVASWFRNNQKTLTRALGAAVRDGAHLGVPGFGS